MRDSLKKSLAHTPAGEFERYAKDSLVLCNACSLPIFRLDEGLALGDRSGKMAHAFKPVSEADLLTLAARTDVDAGVTAVVRGMSADQRAAHLAKLHEVRSGDPMICPCCGQCFVQVVAVGHDEVMDKSYTVELLTVPPEGAGKTTRLGGRRVGGNDWLN